MPARESGGRLRPLTESGPEGSSSGGLRRVARLLIITSMSDNVPIVASRWPTPFEMVDPDKLRLLRVTYPSCAWVHHADGPQYDFTQFTDESDCVILVFSEDDKTVYRIAADVDAIQVHDERDLSQIDEWSNETGKSAFRLVGTPLHQSLSSILNGEQPTYSIITAWDCVEFICLNEPRIEAVGFVEDSRSALN